MNKVKSPILYFLLIVISVFFMSSCFNKDKGGGGGETTQPGTIIKSMSITNKSFFSNITVKPQVPIGYPILVSIDYEDGPSSIATSKDIAFEYDDTMIELNSIGAIVRIYKNGTTTVVVSTKKQTPLGQTLTDSVDININLAINN